MVHRCNCLLICPLEVFLVTDWQWGCCHCVVRCSYGGLVSKPGAMSASVIHVTAVGLCMILIYSTLSGLAGVYSEYILKDKYNVWTVYFLLLFVAVCMAWWCGVSGVEFADWMHHCCALTLGKLFTCICSPSSINCFFQTASTDLCQDRFFWATRFFFIFSLFFRFWAVH